MFCPSVIFFSMANEILFLRVRFKTVAARETQSTPRCMMDFDMIQEFSSLCSSFPKTMIRVVWAFKRFLLCLRVLSNILLVSWPQPHVSRSNRPQLACIILCLSLTAFRPRAEAFLFQNGHFTGLYSNRGIGGIVGSVRVLRGCILVRRQ